MESMAGLLFWKNKCFVVCFDGVQGGVLSERKGKFFSMKRGQDRKGSGINRGKSGMRNLEAESIRSKVESTMGYVKFKTVTEIRWSCACNTFIVCLSSTVLNSLRHWEPVERLKQRNEVVYVFFRMSQTAQF